MSRVTSAQARCPVCGAFSRQWRETRRVAVKRCSACLHRTAEFVGTPLAEDYHGQYEGGARLESLRRTRIRQAGQVWDAVRRHVPDADDFLDFGSGRGWFLRACRDHGLTRGVAADTSQLAVEAAIADGFPAILLPEGESPEHVVSALRTLPFQPRVLTLLDVVEHFSPGRLLQHLEAITAALRPELELVVVKVPAAEGLFHRLAGAAAVARVSGPLEQLYQVGTFPPHYNYFTRTSLLKVADALGWNVLEVSGDPDFEPEALGDRILALQRLPKSLGQAISASAAWATTRVSMPDAQILIARVP